MSEQAHGDPFNLEDPTHRRKLEKNSQKTQGEEARKVAEAVKSAPGPKILLRATVADASVEQEREVVRSEARAPRTCPAERARTGIIPTSPIETGALIRAVACCHRPTVRCDHSGVTTGQARSAIARKRRTPSRGAKTPAEPASRP